MGQKRANRTWQLARFAIGILLLGGMLAAGLSRTSSARPQGASQGSALVDDLQRTYQIDRYNEVAESGPARGETLYYYKCWMCHNALADDRGPHLKGIFERPRLMSGQPVNEETVAAKIKTGGPLMPGFQHSMNDADMADLISYLRSEMCCLEGLEPPANPRYRAEERPWPVPTGLRGGATGVVRSDSGQLLEGIKVQLIAPSGTRTTVFTNAEGRYEFPAMQAGSYTLRIATPVPYKGYRREGVRVDGANTLPEIELEEVPEAGGEGDLPGALPTSLDIQSQLSGAEMLWNLPGTAQEKALFARACGVGCHEYHQIFRSRFNEHGWRAVVERMLRYGTNSLIPRRQGYGFASEEEVATVVRWLAKVRGPDSKDLPLRVFPRVSGASTRVVITEYEMPRRLLSIHDVYGDSKNNIWYTSHRTPYAGVLDPRTGIIKEHKMPPTPGSLPGTHTVVVDNENGWAWFTQRWAGAYFVRLDIATGEIGQFTTRGGSNYGLAPDGSLWVKDGAPGGRGVTRVEPHNAEIVAVYPFRNPTPYQSAVSSDGRFWAGGSPPTTGANTGMMLDIRTGTMYEANSGDRLHSAARGGFEPNGHNAWFGGRDGVLVQIVNEIDEKKRIHIRTYLPPTPYFPYTVFYTAMPDRNGEVWGGVLQGRGFVRFNPQTERWTVYENAEPSALARYIWIDNTTTPVTVWYPDFHTGLIVRIQPLD